MSLTDAVLFISLFLAVANLVILIFLLRQLSVVKKLGNVSLHEKAESINLKLPKLRTKIRKRYLIFEVLSRESIDADRVRRDLRTAIATLYGEPFVMASGFSLVFYNEEKKMGIIRTTRDSLTKVIASLHIAGKEGTEKRIIYVPIKTVGSIKKAKEIIDAMN